jgi:hypothetical protein
VKAKCPEDFDVKAKLFIGPKFFHTLKYFIHFEEQRTGTGCRGRERYREVGKEAQGSKN